MIPQVDRLFNRIKERGWMGRMVPIGHLSDLKEAICDRFQQGLLDDALYREQLSSFSFDSPTDLPRVRSIIIVAVPTPQMRIIFHWRGVRVPISL